MVTYNTVSKLISIFLRTGRKAAVDRMTSKWLVIMFKSSFSVNNGRFSYDVIVFQIKNYKSF